MTLLGVIALGAGLSTMVLGASSIIGAGDVSPTVDSEMRYYSVWYAVTGLVLLRTAPRVASERTIIRAVCAALFIGGCMRAISLVTIGRPHDFSLMLMVLELTIPLVLVPWQAAVARKGPAGGG